MASVLPVYLDGKSRTGHLASNQHICDETGLSWAGKQPWIHGCKAETSGMGGMEGRMEGGRDGNNNGPAGHGVLGITSSGPLPNPLSGGGGTGFLSVQHKANLRSCPETKSRAAHTES